MHKLLNAGLILSILGLVACGGRDDNVSVAEQFSKDLTKDLKQDILVTKAITKQGGYVVFKNDKTDQFFALNMDDYSRGEDAQKYYNSQAEKGNFQGGLTNLGNGDFRASNGALFEETAMTSKDLEKIEAFSESRKKSQITDLLAEQFGLSEERSQTVANLVINMDLIKKSRGITAADAAALSQELLGFKINDARTALANKIYGNSTQYNELVAKAATVNGLTPEDINQIINERYLK
jgi:hypothetical protein